MNKPAVKNIRLSLFKLNFLLVTSALLFFAAPSYAQSVRAREEFDSVTAPALPTGWSSGSLVGSQSAITVNTSDESTPNAALLPAPDATSLTALVTKTFSINTGFPSNVIDFDFRHRRGMENGFDGGVLEVSINGGQFRDLTDAAIGGSFSSGGYNTLALFGSTLINSLAGRPAWTGESASFESVNATIPNIPDNSTIVFRFLVGTDASIGKAGWLIDNVSLEMLADLSVSLTPLSNEIAPGGQVSIDDTFLNPSSFYASGNIAYLFAPVSIIKSVSLPSSATYQKMGNWLSFIAATDPVEPFSAETSIVVIKDIIGSAGAKLKLTTAASAEYTNISTALAFLSSSPNIPGGIISGELVYAPFDPCTPPGVLPYDVTGRIVAYFSSLTCPYGQAALALQNLGAKAALLLAPSSAFSPPQIPSPFVTEASTPGLTIPVLTFDSIILGLFAGGIGSGLPGTVIASLEGNNSAELRTIPVSVQQQAGGLALGDNLVTALVNVVTDVDGDGTPDIRDLCKLDGGKSAPGVCGCGKVEQDLNANGVTDCLNSSDFKAQVSKILALVKKLSVKSKLFKETKKQISTLKLGVFNTGINNASTISAVGAADIAALSRKADKLVQASLNAKSAPKLKKAISAASKALNALINSIAG